MSSSMLVVFGEVQTEILAGQGYENGHKGLSIILYNTVSGTINDIELTIQHPRYQ